MDGSIIYCRFPNKKGEYNLNSKLYAYYLKSNIPMKIGTLFKIAKSEFNYDYKDAILRCENIVGIQDKTDAEFFENRKLCELYTITIINQPTEDYIYYRLCDRYSKLCSDLEYSAQKFWDEIIQYEHKNYLKEKEWNLSKDDCCFNFLDVQLNKNITIENSIDEKENNMENKNMFEGMFKNMEFGKIITNDIKYSFNGIAFRTIDNEYVVYNEDCTFTNVGNMTIDIPIFAMPVAKDQIRVRDVIKHNRDWVIVNSISDKEIKVTCPNTKEIVTIVPETSIFGFNFYTKVINPLESFIDTANEQNPFGNMPLLMLMNKENKNFEDILMMMMLSNNKTMNLDNPMMLYAMGSGDNSDSIKTLMLMNNMNLFKPKVEISTTQDTDIKQALNSMQEISDKVSELLLKQYCNDDDDEK